MRPLKTRRTLKIRPTLARHAAVLRNSANRLQRPKVTGIRCGHCSKWVKPRRYDPLLYVCTDCAPALAHAHYETARDTALIAEAQRREYEKELHAWRRQLATSVVR